MNKIKFASKMKRVERVKVIGRHIEKCNEGNRSVNVKEKRSSDERRNEELMPGNPRLIVEMKMGTGTKISLIKRGKSIGQVCEMSSVADPNV